MTEESADAQRTLYGVWLSPFMSIVAHVLEEAELVYQYERTSPFTGASHTNDHLQKNAFGKVPVLQDSLGVNIGESQAICRYLARQYESARQFYPCDDAVACAEVDRLNDFITFSISGPFLNWFAVGEFFPKTLRVNTVEESKVFSLWSEILVKGAVSQLVSSASMNPFLLGEKPCLADFHLFYLLEHGKTFAKAFNEPSFNFLASNEDLIPFYEAMLEREATKRVLGFQADELGVNENEMFEKMEGTNEAMLIRMKPILSMLFGHEV